MVKYINKFYFCFNMNKRDFTNNELVRILVRISLDEYQRIKKVIGLPDILNQLNYKKGSEISTLKGFILVPDILKLEHYARGEGGFSSMDNIQNQGLEYFIRNIIPKDNATLIGQAGIGYGYTLETATDAEKVYQRINGNDNLTINDILRIYSLKDLTDIGQRERVSITTHLILKSQDILEELYKESPERFEGLKVAFDMDASQFKKETTYNNVAGFYNGEIICKMQTAASDTTLLGPIKLFHPKDEIGESVEFTLIGFSECSPEIKAKYSRRKTVMDRYVKKKILSPKVEFIFDEGVNNNPIVGLLRMYVYDSNEEKAVINEEYLIQPSELGIPVDVPYTPAEKLGSWFKKIIPRKS